MIIDLFSCIPFELITQQKSTNFDYKNLAKIARIPRFYKLLRLAKLAKVLKNSNLVESVQDYFKINQSVMRFISSLSYNCYSSYRVVFLVLHS